MNETRALNCWMLIPFVALSAAVIAFGQQFPPGEWFRELNQPPIAPPNWIFGVVWTPLYLMIAIAGWILWERARGSWAMWFWCLQLALNAAWSWIFFGLHRIDVALIEIVVLWLATGATIVAAWRPARAAAWLLVPYWAWVTFATVLNGWYWILNR